MNRITELFTKKREGVISVFFTAGYPKLDDTVEIALSLASRGVDLLEIGMPFSDPVADGPVIQASSTEAIENGMNLHKLLEQVKEIRKSSQIPIVLMGYFNPIYQFGPETFFREASSAGVDGFILPDLPFQLFELKYRDIFKQHDLSWIPLVTPLTGEDRIRNFDEVTQGFIYAVSTAGITGMTGLFSEEAIQYFNRLADMKLANPVMVGFGVSSKETIDQVCSHLQGVVIGSAFIKHLSKSASTGEGISNFANQVLGHPLT